MAEDRATITTFSAQPEEWDYVVPSQLDPTYRSAYEETCQPHHFFSRPVRIYTNSWTPNTDFFDSFDPWSLYFNNKRVVNRISNYALLRCKLCIKIVVNGNGFYYGRMMADYLPLWQQDTMTRNRALFYRDVVEASQRPHIFIDTTTSTGGDLCMPFVWYYDALCIPQGEWDQMGAITLRSLSTLRHANGDTTPVTISVFAWAEDVELSMPTSANPASIVPQSEEVDHPTMSTAATAVAGVAARMKNVPGIGPYATAAEVTANAVADLAKSFGYSRAKMLDAKTDVRPNPFGTQSAINDSDIVETFALDAKQGVTLDSRVFGLDGTDELAISGLVSRESYLDYFEWYAAEPVDGLLATIAVTPTIWNQATVSGVTEIHMPACCAISAPFLWWRGVMRYRFQFNSSAFHKGRLRFVYEPYGLESTEWNINYTHVMDLAEERDITIEVGWGSRFPYIKTLQPGNSNLPYDMLNAGNIPSLLTPDSRYNGTLSVYVVNGLTLPSSTALADPVVCSVFVSADPELQLQVPNDNGYANLHIYPPGSAGQGILQEEFIEPQSVEVTGADDMNLNTDNAPVHPRCTRLLGVRPGHLNEINKVVFGETTNSIRSLIKRYCTVGCTQPVSVSANTPGRLGFTFGDYSENTGAATSPTVAWYASSALGYNIVPGAVSLMHYYSRMFLCRRGAIRQRTFLVNRGTTGSFSPQGYVQYATLERIPQATQKSSQFITGTDITSDLVGSQQAIGSGGAQILPYLNNMFSYETPYYTNKRFYLAKLAVVENTDDANTYCQLRAFLTGTGQSFDWTASRTVAAGDDYTLGFFLGSPVVFKYSTVNI